MGNQKGFLGKSLLAFVILCCLVRLWRPVIFLHECTRLFKWTVFNEEDLLKGYLCHSTTVNPTEYGFPISRSRAYSAIVRCDWLLEVGLDQLFRLHISSALDAGSFFAASKEEAGCVRGVWYRSQLSLSLPLNLYIYICENTSFSSSIVVDIMTNDSNSKFKFNLQSSTFKSIHSLETTGSITSHVITPHMHRAGLLFVLKPTPIPSLLVKKLHVVFVCLFVNFRFDSVHIAFAQSATVSGG